MPKILTFTASRVPEDLRVLLCALGEEYPIHDNDRDGAMKMTFEPGAPKGTVEISVENNTARIAYDKPCHAARGIGAMLAGIASEGKQYSEQSLFDTFGIMLDCSRNAVVKVDQFKRWLRRLALLGYNMAMLYTEETYELPDEPYFGYLRGRYTQKELREINEYANKLGIEMIGCIQTLGHLDRLLKWSPYGEIRDTSRVMLVDNEKTYELIDKMIGNFAQNFSSRRIHLGMDEAHDLGLGEYLRVNGYRNRFDIFNQHVARVLDICKKYNLQPMIWSDMYFGLGSGDGGYYGDNWHVPEDAKEQIPKDVGLVYWDYYHEDESTYEKMITRHKTLGSTPIMASAVWSWDGSFWHWHDKTERTVRPCIQACRNNGVKEFFLTIWGDDGACCVYDSIFSGLAYSAEMAYGNETSSPELLEKRFEAICGDNYQDVVHMAKLNMDGRAASIMWDDPLIGIYWKQWRSNGADLPQKASDDYKALLQETEHLSDKTEPFDFAHAVNLITLLKAKIDLRLELDEAYEGRNIEGLKQISGQIPRMIELIDNVLASFRRQWLKHSKTLGFEVIQIRFGGLKQRYLELGQRIDELVAGTIDAIPELDEVPPQPLGYLPETWQILKGAAYT